MNENKNETILDMWRKGTITAEECVRLLDCATKEPCDVPDTEEQEITKKQITIDDITDEIMYGSSDDVPESDEDTEVREYTGINVDAIVMHMKERKWRYFDAHGKSNSEEDIRKVIRSHVEYCVRHLQANMEGEPSVSSGGFEMCAYCEDGSDYATIDLKFVPYESSVFIKKSDFLKVDA